MYKLYKVNEEQKHGISQVILNVVHVNVNKYIFFYQRTTNWPLFLDKIPEITVFPSDIEHKELHMVPLTESAIQDEMVRRNESSILENLFNNNDIENEREDYYRLLLVIRFYKSQNVLLGFTSLVNVFEYILRQLQGLLNKKHCPSWHRAT